MTTKKKLRESQGVNTKMWLNSTRATWMPNCVISTVTSTSPQVTTRQVARSISETAEHDELQNFNQTSSADLGRETTCKIPLQIRANAQFYYANASEWISQNKSQKPFVKWSINHSNSDKQWRYWWQKWQSQLNERLQWSEQAYNKSNNAVIIIKQRDILPIIIIIITISIIIIIIISNYCRDKTIEQLSLIHPNP